VTEPDAESYRFDTGEPSQRRPILWSSLIRIVKEWRLCVVLALYAFAMFGYVTATLATFFVARDADRPDAPLASQAAIDSVARDIAELRAIVLNRTAPVTSSDASGTSVELNNVPHE
jgi:hypothetical protein